MSSSIYFDLTGGASGDMLLSSLVGLGVPPRYLKRQLKTLHIKGKFECKEASCGHASVIKARFLYPPDTRLSYNKIMRLIKNSSFEKKIQDLVLERFSRIAAVERKIHKVRSRDFAFHHLGEPDAILEIASFYLGLSFLEADSVYVSSFALSRPAPATLELLKNKKVVFKDAGYESVTPTAALLLQDACQTDSPFSYDAFTYAKGDAGDEDYLTAYLSKEKLFFHDTVIKIEATVDDMNPQGFELLFDALLSAGALEVYIEQVIAKKSRPAFIINVLSTEKDAPVLKRLLFQHTTTFGLRYCSYGRDKLKSSCITKKTRWGKVRFRVCEIPGLNKESPEYDDLKKISQKHKIPLIELYKKLR